MSPLICPHCQAHAVLVTTARASEESREVTLLACLLCSRSVEVARPRRVERFDAAPPRRGRPPMVKKTPVDVTDRTRLRSYVDPETVKELQVRGYLR